VSVRFYYASGSPYAWRVWLALERKGIPYHQKTLSFSEGDLKTQEYGALNPRRRVPVLVDDDFVLAESAAIVEYIEDRWPNGPALFAREPRKRAIQRRMVREADDYLAKVGTRFATGPAAEETAKELREELALWEGAATGDY
jgi:glutathione S-transferase